mmetsp:Transcript_58051/g.136040  ORF Transcript_58051/g.136040 Transcript_58051/m.136040 type:complete len:461 (+) Transcript_58051:73-1455(+)
MPTARARPIKPLGTEVSCAILAKGQQRLTDVLAGTCETADGKKWKGGAHKLQQILRKDFHSKLCNGMVCFSANLGRTEQAERWMNHLDHKQGDTPEVQSLNMLLQALIREGDLPKADEWFQKTKQGALHPELGSLRPNRSSYDVMIQGAARADDIVRAERYLMELLERTGDRPHRNSFREVVVALLRAGEPRRAHEWMEDYVKKGCAFWRSYDADVVRTCSRELRHRRTYNVEEHFELVETLARALAGAGNTVTANHWLEYLVRCGQRPSGSVETWDLVRAATPREILSARLYCEEPTEHMFTPPEANRQGVEMWRDRAPLQLPALLSGEREEDRHRYILQEKEKAATPEVEEGDAQTEKRGASQASTRAETLCASRPTTAAADQGRGSALASQGLQKSLQMKWQREKIAQANSARELCRQAAAERSKTAQGKVVASSPPPDGRASKDLEEDLPPRPSTS